MLVIDVQNTTLNELKTAAGFFYNATCTTDAGAYPRAVLFCFHTHQGLKAEIEAKEAMASPRGPVH